MLCALLSSLTVLGLVLIEPADATSDLAANAALKYWQAFATMPKLSDAEAQRLSTQYLTEPLGDAARSLAAQADYALTMLHRGAALSRCEWGLGAEDGIYARLPYATAARVLANLACLRARLRFEEGKPAAAVDDLLDGLALGRHAAQDSLMLMLLVGASIEQRATEALAVRLPRLDPPLLADLNRRLRALPPGGSPARALQLEEKFGLDGFIHIVKDAKDSEQLLSLLAPLCLPGGEGRPAPEQARAFVDKCGGSARMLTLAEAIRPAYARLAAKLDLPPDQFDREFASEEARQADNPVFKVVFPELHKVRRQHARTEIRRALLAAAVAVVASGPTALDDHPDPFAKGRFEYQPFAGGFELRSKTQFAGKPVVLTVGQRGN